MNKEIIEKKIDPKTCKIKADKEKDK